MKKSRGSGLGPVLPSRSNTGSSIRGKISAPIPLVDNEFPILTPRIGVAVPIGFVGTGKQRQSPTPPLQLDFAQDEENKVSLPAQEPLRTDISEPASKTPSHEFPPPQARRVSPLRGSDASNPPERYVEKPQRKKSTLRSVFGRLFGRKRKSGSSAGVLKGNPERIDPHRSDPTALRRPSNQILSPKRSASMPINDFNRALNSHSPFLENAKTKDLRDMRAYQDEGGDTRTRQSVDPSRLYEAVKLPGYFNFTGLRPRPASSHERSSGVFAEDGSNVPIGFAVTSGSHPNRRSRSLGHLRAADTQQGARRRSDEIRYWRESYDPDALSPMSSHHRPETQGNDQAQEPGVQEVPQPFNFGLMSEMAGMKITQAASLEERVSRLEERFREMEKALVGPHGQRSNSIVLQDSTRNFYINNVPVLRSGTDFSEHSSPRHPPNTLYLQSNNPQADMSFRFHDQSHTTSRPSTDSTHPSYYRSYEELSPQPTNSSSPEQNKPARPSRTNISTLQIESMARPLSTSTTIRGNASSSPLRSPGTPLQFKNESSAAHQYTALLNLIEAEQRARASLETQVETLQRQIQSLLSNSNNARNNADLTARPDSVAYPKAMRMTGESGEYSSFELEETGSESGREGYDENMEEVFQTPREERAYYGTQEEYEQDSSEMDNQRNPRTMSLSQLTMGKAALASVNI